VFGGAGWAIKGEACGAANTERVNESLSSMSDRSSPGKRLKSARSIFEQLNWQGRRPGSTPTPVRWRADCARRDERGSQE
jgi:hypothetical protein